MGENMENNLEGKSIEELLEMQKDCLHRMAGCLCELITREIDNDSTKKRVRAWLKSLRDVRNNFLEIKGASSEILTTIKDTEDEAEGFLFQPKR
jgi:hypothetical protein